jgi:hypothetical protein
MGTGTGSFQTASAFASGAVPISLVNGDFNVDGKMDIAVASQYQGFATILLGNGTGSFVSNGNFGAGGLAVSIATADFDGDSKRDLALPNGNTGLCFMQGDNAGSFGPKQTFTVGAGPSEVVAADFNGDGRMDAAVATGEKQGQIAVLLNCGTTPTVNGLADKGPDQELSFYPNPACDEISVSAGGQHLVNVEIFDPRGTLLLSRLVTDGRISISSLPEGIYFISCFSGTHRFNSRLAVVR